MANATWNEANAERLNYHVWCGVSYAAQQGRTGLREFYLLSLPPSWIDFSLFAYRASCFVPSLMQRSAPTMTPSTAPTGKSGCRPEIDLQLMRVQTELPFIVI
jgi:hypothetical protein